MMRLFASHQLNGASFRNHDLALTAQSEIFLTVGIAIWLGLLGLLRSKLGQRGRVGVNARVRVRVRSKLRAWGKGGGLGERLGLG